MKVYRGGKPLGPAHRAGVISEELHLFRWLNDGGLEIQDEDKDEVRWKVVFDSGEVDILERYMDKRPRTQY